MIINQYVKNFENLGFGLFVHFGLYSIVGKGEWAKLSLNITDKEYEQLTEKFIPDDDWAFRLAEVAKNAGCKYMTFTTRHHDGFSLYDMCGLSTYDSIHGSCGRDIVKEFVEACREFEIKPFFYHTLLDWKHEAYKNDFKAYLKYLRDGIEILCKNYGEIGGFWFDGMWDKPDADWEEDELYGTIRKYQPEAMIINNTGLSARGELGHIELDSVTFERGKVQPINLENSPKYIASEMCEVLNDHWGYAKFDVNYNSPAQMIETLAECRRYRANFLLNVGPMGNGKLRKIDEGILEIIGKWNEIYNEAIYEPIPTNIVVEGREKDFILKKDNQYYLFSHNIPMVADENVAIGIKQKMISSFKFDRTIRSFKWLDDSSDVDFTQESGIVKATLNPFEYGRSLVVRIAKFECE